MVSNHRPLATIASNKTTVINADLMPPRINEIKVIIVTVKNHGELDNTLSSGLRTPTVTTLLRPAVKNSRFSVTQTINESAA
ncbi:unannotated protein [freshwater metagenome]|uniref:Unannotated protein n=1 Tax=freshwater metagenome TaxID=449393 RepID=A0A6J5Z6X8_9ZZZZ